MYVYMLGGVRPISLPLPEDLLVRVDRARGSVPRTVWIREAVERALGDVIRDGPLVPAPRRAVKVRAKPGRVAEVVEAKCEHPRSARKSLGYAVQCGECGEVVK